MLEKQLLTLVAVIKKIQLKLKSNNISIEELNKLVKDIQKELGSKTKPKELEDFSNKLNEFKTQLQDNREKFDVSSVSYKEIIKQLSTSLQIGLNDIQSKLNEFITKEDINKLEKDIDIKIKSIKIEKPEESKQIEVGKVYTIDAGNEAKVEITETKDKYKLDFYIPRGVSGRGMPGKGIATGGTTNQVLAKASNEDYDTKWVTDGGGGGTDNHAELTNLEFANSGHTGFQPSGDYALSSEIPTKTSELTNDSGFITTPYTLPTASTTVLGGVKIDGSTIAINDGVISATTGGGGDVTGPTGATADNIAVFNSTTGKIIKDGGTKISDLQPAGTYSTDIHANITALNAVSGTNTGNQVATDFDIKDLTDSTSLRTTWSGKQDALGFTPENVANKKTDLTDNSDTYYPSQKAVKTAVDGKVDKSTYDANSILYATTDNTPVALTVGVSTIVGRKATGDIVALTKAETLAILNVEDGAEVNNISDANATDLTDSGATTLHKHSYNNLDDKPTIPSPYTLPIASDSVLGGIKVGANLSIDGNGVLSASAGSAYTDEMAQDAVGTILTDTATIDFTYTDATPKIEADVKDASITYAKIQNISATDKLLGRSSAGSGSTEEIACTAAGRALLDDADAATQRTTLGLGTYALNNNDGWIVPTGTWSYSSADAPTFVISVNADMTATIGVGMRIKLTQTNVKYFIVTAVGAYSGGNTLITVYGGTDYTLADAAITLPYYSMMKSPLGFPLVKEKWAVVVTDTTARSKTSPNSGTLYNLGDTAISVPIGYFKLSYSILVAGTRGSAGNIPVAVLLSTSTSAISDAALLRKIEATAVTQFGYISLYCEKNISVASKTTYYMIIYAGTSGLAGIYEGNSQQTLTITAECGYL